MIFLIAGWDYTRDVALILNGILIAITFLTGVDLGKKFLSADEQTRKTETFLIFKIMSAVVVGYSFYNIPSIMTYYFIDYKLSGIDPFYINSVNVIFQLMMIFPVAVVCERIILPKKFLLKVKGRIIPATFIIGTIVITSIVIFVLTNHITLANQQPWFNTVMIILLAFTYTVFSLFAFIGVIYIIFVRMGPQKEDRNKILVSLLGLIIAFTGGMITVAFREIQPNKLYPAIDSFEGQMMLVSIGIEIIGWFIFRLQFLSIKDYTELEWKSGLEDMYIIMAETGIGLYACEFNKSSVAVGAVENINLSGAEISEKINADLIAGGMIGIKSMLSEIAGTKKGVLEVLSLKDKNLICKQGKYVLAVLKARANLGVYHTMLRQLIDEIEEKNEKALAGFRGDLRTLSIDPIVKAAFGKIVDPNVQSVN